MQGDWLRLRSWFFRPTHDIKDTAMSKLLGIATTLTNSVTAHTVFNDYESVTAPDGTRFIVRVDATCLPSLKATVIRCGVFERGVEDQAPRATSVLQTTSYRAAHRHADNLLIETARAVASCGARLDADGEHWMVSYVASSDSFAQEPELVLS